MSLGDILGPEFAASPPEMFGPDRFHPSVAGYASAAAALLPSLCAALGVWIGGRRGAGSPTCAAARASGRSPLAAAEAADEPGTEVAGAARSAAAGRAGRRGGPLPAPRPPAAPDGLGADRAERARPADGSDGRPSRPDAAPPAPEPHRVGVVTGG